jgi:hypothetical protein
MRNIMNRFIRTGFVAVGTVLVLTASGCSFPTSGTKNTARVTISIPQADNAVSRSGGGTVGETLPTLSTFHLAVSSPDMTTIAADFTAGSVSVTVPAGSNRTFTLTAQATNAVFTGTKSVDLAPSTTVSLSITLAAKEPKLIAPLGSKIARFDDATGMTSTSIAAADLTDGTGTALSDLPASFSFSDASWDTEGYIYASSGDTGADSAYRILKIRDVTNGGQADAFLKVSSPVTSIAVDRTNGLLLYCTKGDNHFSYRTLKLSDTGNTNLDLANPGYNEELATIGLSGTVIALDADDAGIVFLLCEDSANTGHLVRLSGSMGANSVMTYASSATIELAAGTPVDVQVAGSSVYVLFEAGAQAIESFVAADLSGGTSSGSIVGSTGGPNAASETFASPQRFLIGPSGSIAVLDRNEATTPATNSVVSFTASGFARKTMNTIVPSN